MYISPANIHDLTVLKDNATDLISNLQNSSFIGDKGYVSEEFTSYLKDNKVYLVPIKRNNMVRRIYERDFYKRLNNIRKKIETCFSCLMELFPKRIRAISKKGLSVKLLCFVIAYNIIAKIKLQGKSDGN